MIKLDINKEKIEEVLTRGVEQVLPSKEALKKLMQKRKIRVYLGIDPTGKLHLGHLAVLKKLRQFQDLGHETIVLIGDFTATIGDPTGKYTTRKTLTRKQVLAYAQNYKKQIKKILDFSKSNVRFLHNEDWINKLKPIDMLSLASKFTVARLLERDMFQRRIKAGRDIHLHEFLYPIFQAYDSLTMDVDLEIGGSDQIFNMLAGRTLLKKVKKKEKFVLATKLLVDPTGKKMGKTEGNIINLDESPKEMFGKIMAWPDSLIITGFELCTDLSKEKIKEISQKIKNKKLNPRDAKARLAKEIVKLYQGERAAIKAEEEFKRVFKERKLPTEIPKIKISQKSLNILDLLVKTKLVFSKSEAKRLILQRGVKIDGETQKDWGKIVRIEKGLVIQMGKRRFRKII